MLLVNTIRLKTLGPARLVISLFPTVFTCTLTHRRRQQIVCPHHIPALLHIVKGGKMKGFTVAFRSFLSLTVIYWMATTFRMKKDVPSFITNPLEQLRDYVLHLMEPRIERSYIAVPETFMTTVT